MAEPSTPADMDAAAEKAATDLSYQDADAVKLIAQWWKNNYMKAGHKRLARVLLATLKKEATL
jgi:hypothetical protein